MPRPLLALLICGLLLTPACGSPPYIDLPNPVAGTITAVGPIPPAAEADTFVLSTATGERYLFRNANPEDPGMGQTHLRQHLADRVQVLVAWERDGYDLVAVRIDDAPTPSASGTPAGIGPSG